MRKRAAEAAAELSRDLQAGNFMGVSKADLEATLARSVAGALDDRQRLIAALEPFAKHTIAADNDALHKGWDLLPDSHPISSNIRIRGGGPRTPKFGDMRKAADLLREIGELRRRQDALQDAIDRLERGTVTHREWAAQYGSGHVEER